MSEALRIESNDEKLQALRICHVVGNLGVGGAERQIANLLNASASLRPLLVLIDRHPPQDLVSGLASGVEVVCCPVRISQWLWDIPGLASLLRRRRINILHTHMFWPSLHGAVAAALGRVPVLITTEHGRNQWKRAWHRWVERNIISRRAARRICVSRDILELRVEKDRLPQAQMIMIPNGTPLNELNRPPRVPTARLLAVGRLIPAKDYSSLLAAAKILAARNVPFSLQIAGNGPLREELATQCKQLGIDAHVRFLGNRDDIPVLMQHHDIFVLSSEREGQPLVLLEAMANAMPIVATRVGGIPETLVDGVEGTLVPERNPVALADALQFLIENPAVATEWGNHARERVRKDFSIESVARRHFDLYRNALAAVPK